MNDLNSLKSLIQEMHFEIVKQISKNISENYTPELVNTENLASGDVSYNIDIHAEQIILNKLEVLKSEYKIQLVMEGIGKKILFHENEKLITIIIDPIDGTREIMFDKRSAWILTGISFLENPNLSDIELAIQTEIPTSKQNIFSYLYAIKDEGAYEELYEKSTFTKIKSKKRLCVKNFTTLKDSYICFPNPFPGTKKEIAEKYERFYKKIFPNNKINDAKVFSDEYISTGGQLYLLTKGCYSLVVDIRDYVQVEKHSLCCHPYDLCTILIPIESGASITNLQKKELDYPLDTTTNCNWIGCANKLLFNEYYETLLDAIL